jgi:23S rRNA (cytidine2498-2'-O)-methyltransferase
MLASPACSSPYPNGAYIFEENKTEAPSRAYLKLWEALTRLQKFPKAGETCIDLGACPGGWTWVLQRLGANVISVDKAPLAPPIAALPNIRYIQQSAFGLNPEEIGAVDWLFSDIICYPERALRLIENWKKSGLVRNMVSTIKFQGKTDYETLKKFMEIPGSSIFHLYNNKHEVTWVNLEGSKT